jgi:streptogramin lyase
MTRRVAPALTLAALLLAGLSAPAGADYRDPYTFGTGRFGADGPGAVTEDAAGNIYATDPTSGQVERFSAVGDSLGAWGDGALSNPRGVDVDPFGRIYVGDTGHNRIARFSPQGFLSVATAASQLNSPEAVATDAAGQVVVADRGYLRIQPLSPDLASLAALNVGDVTGVAVDADGNVYASIGAQVREFTGAGMPVATFSGLAAPRGVAVDDFGDVFVADTGSIIKLAPNGTQLAQLPAQDARDVALDPDGGVVASVTGGLERWVAVAPQTTIDTAPSGLIDDPNPQFTFSSPSAGVTTFECLMAGSGDGWAPCTSPFSASGLAAGLNDFAVRAVDAQGIRDPTPAVAEFSEVGAQGPPGVDGIDGLDGARGPRGRRGKAGGLIVKGKVLKGLSSGTTVRLGMRPSIALRGLRVELRLGSSHGTIVAAGVRKRLPADRTTVVRLQVVRATSARDLALVVHGRTTRGRAVLLAKRLR